VLRKRVTSAIAPLVVDRKYSFWVSAGGQSVNVEVANHEGHQYLNTEADRLQRNNLLALDERP
jgi:Protein of unknown function (DUF3892)